MLAIPVGPDYLALYGIAEIIKIICVFIDPGLSGKSFLPAWVNHRTQKDWPSNVSRSKSKGVEMFLGGILLTLLSWSIGFPIWIAFVMGGLFLLVFWQGQPLLTFPHIFYPGNGFLFSPGASLFSPFRTDDDHRRSFQGFISLDRKFRRASLRGTGHCGSGSLYVFRNDLRVYPGHDGGHRQHGHPGNAGEGL